jgi:hypothetical protein
LAVEAFGSSAVHEVGKASCAANRIEWGGRDDVRLTYLGIELLTAENKVLFDITLLGEMFMKTEMEKQLEMILIAAISFVGFSSSFFQERSPRLAVNNPEQLST